MEYKNKKVSVIVPNYNYAAYLEERIESVLNQSYQDFELIILDDCSTDNSRILIEQYRSDPHVSHIVYNEVNTGSPFKQWAKGVELAKGEYIWIAESDDTASKSFLSELVPQLDSSPDVVLAFSHSFLIDSEGNKLDEDIHNNSGDDILFHDGQKFAENVMSIRNYIYNASMVVFRRSAFFQVDKSSYEHYRSCGDWAFWTRICLQGKIVEVCKRLNYFRIHQKRVTFEDRDSGNDWKEVSAILSSYIPLFHFRGLRLSLYKGKWTKDLLVSRVVNKQFFIDNYPEVYGATRFEIFLYRVSRIPFRIKCLFKR